MLNQMNEVDQLRSQLAEAKADLKATKEELDAICYAISHDLRAPLRSVRGFSQAFAKKYEKMMDEVGRDYINRINSSGEEMSLLIDGLLALSRITREPMEKTEINLSQMIETLALVYTKKFPERKVNLKIDPNMKVYGDEKLLKVAIDNLLANAWKYTSKTAVAEISAQRLQRDGKILYSISDNGVGFDMKSAPKLFSAFQRLHHPADFQGAGLGLACARRVFHRHGGEIWGEGRLGEGAVFSFQLPTQEGVPS